MMKFPVTFSHTISVEDYENLRRSVDFAITTRKRARIALDNSLYTIIALIDEKPVGMARVVGDGGFVYFICDVIVHPDYQSGGIGKALITNVLTWIENQVAENETVMVNLMSAYEKEPFYEKLGFNRRPFENHGCGMSKWIHK